MNHETVYHEELPSVTGWIRNKLTNPKERIRSYFLSLFPFITWIYRYNLVWFSNDIIAGLTVAAVVIPQGMAYAGLAKLAPQFGLYSSFVGVIIYWFFATSKDITIGPVAVMSILTGTIVDDIHKLYPEYDYHVIASALAVVVGCAVCALGMFRLGFVVNFIPLPALAAFTTGSALNIIVGQVPVLMGNNKSFDTRQSPFLVFINFWKNIRFCNYNAILGLSALVLLYSIRLFCTYAIRRYPRREKLFFFLNTLRTVFIILIYLFISWLINRHDPTHPHTAILGTIPQGFQNMAVPTIDRTMLSELVTYLPSAIIVLVIEHIAIAKAFGRINNYAIDPNQELIAIGVTNVLGSFFGAYPATGSFSRTAIKSKAGVRTPLAGVITGIVIVLAIYVLTPVFFWISQASLAAVIIHAIGDLIIGPKTLKQFWRVNPLEFLIFWIGILVTVFSNIENGIYVCILTSLLLLLYRFGNAEGKFLGQIQFVSEREKRNVYISMNHSDGTNPMIDPVEMNDGIFIYRIYEDFLYPNAANYMEKLVEEVFRKTKSGKSFLYKNLGEQPWNLQTSRHPQRQHQLLDPRPHLHAIILDFTGISHVDITSLQHLVDIRQQLDNYTNSKVNWHFVGIANPWIKRALLAHGFGSSNDINQTFAMANANSILVPILDTSYPLFHVDVDEAYQTALVDLAKRQNIDSSALTVS
ncbi:unnamed protein product [Adineta ricciae]|uniref:STAS domain-containing protein n=3 Tax=Adineta ricciae TaxID=249248 RepID=A0A815F3U9_ADIRI|nr:unnamed protein product [Adineta ricciae]